MSDLLDVIDKAARTAANGVIIRTLDATERYEIAWSACAIAAVEHLTETGEAPHPSSIVKAGLDAVGSEQWQYAHDRGIGVERGHGVYWERGDLDTTPHPESVVERVAVRQALDSLTGEARALIETVAATESISRAADLHGEAYATTAAKYRTARTAFYRAWFDGETPPAVPQPRRRYQRKTKCVRGHARAPDNLYRNGTCKKCVRDRRVAA